MGDSVKQRIVLFIKYLGIGQTKFEKIVGLSNGYINNISKGIGADKLQKILNIYPQLNQNWLLTGEGEMLRSDEATVAQSGHTIKYFPNVDGSMGGVRFLDNPNEMSMEIIIPGYSDCQFAINVYGDSMSPLIRSGQVVLLSPWSEKFIDWGKIYLVVTKSGYRAVKRLFPSKKQGFLVCRSENAEENPEFEVEMEDICWLYLVKGWICRESI